MERLIPIFGGLLSGKVPYNAKLRLLQAKNQGGAIIHELTFAYQVNELNPPE